MPGTGHQPPVHEIQRAGRWVARVVAASGPLIALCFYLGVSIWLLALAHALAAWGAWRLWRTPLPGGRELGLQAFSLTFCFPVVGSVCAWVVLGRQGQTHSDVLDAYRDYIKYDHQQPLVLRTVDPRARLLREVGVMPLRDQLLQGDISLKQAAAEALAALPGHEGVKALRQALTAELDDTRMLASLVLLHKEEQFFAALTAARQACLAPGASAIAWCELADVTRRYVESGLPAHKTALGFWQECELAATRALRLSDDHKIQSWQYIAASRAGRQDWLGALEAYGAVLALDPDCLDAVLARCKALFALGRLDQLAEATRPLAATEEMADFAVYWGGPNGS
jgi:tetratricopeptide (TPR) repeat protein